jgi:transcriptional regulator with XRE-family HTH domain
MFSEVKTKEPDRAREMRRQEGRSVKEIARLLCVSRSTVSLWVRDIPLTADQQAELERRNPIYNRQLNGAAVNAARGRERRRGYQETGRRLAERASAVYVAGCMLYWAEGAKARHQLRLANADPALIALFVKFLREHFAVSDCDLRIKCHLFADHLQRQEEVEQFWLDLLGLGRSNLQKSYVNVYSRASKKKRANKLPYGTCHVIVNDTKILHEIYGSIQALAGFDRPEWLG